MNMIGYSATINRRAFVPTSSYSANAEVLVEKKFGWIIYCLVIVFWLGQIWCTPYGNSSEGYKQYGLNTASYMNPIMQVIHKFLYQPTLLGNRLPIYDVCLCALILYLIVIFRDLKGPDKVSKVIFSVSLLVVIVSFMNPNNSFPNLQYLLSAEPRILYLYPLCLYAFLFLRADILYALLRKFFIIGAFLALFLAAYSMVAFLIGMGPIFLGHAVPLPNSENLDWMNIFSGIFLSLYFNSGKKKYLIYVLLFHLVVFFSDRRAQTFVLFFSDIMLTAYYFKRFNFAKLKKLLVPGLLIVIFLVIYVSFVGNLEVIERSSERIAVAISPEESTSEYYSDSGHWDQTVNTFKTLFDHLDNFWGAGMRNEMYQIEGQSGYIHNNFVVVWSVYGLHMVIFYIFLLILFLWKSLSLYRQKFSETNMIVVAPVFTYLLTIIGGAFTGDYIFRYLIHMVPAVMCLSVFKLSNKTIYIDRFLKSYPNGSGLPAFAAKIRQ